MIFFFFSIKKYKIVFSNPTKFQWIKIAHPVFKNRKSSLIYLKNSAFTSCGEFLFTFQKRKMFRLNLLYLIFILSLLNGSVHGQSCTLDPVTSSLNPGASKNEHEVSSSGTTYLLDPKFALSNEAPGNRIFYQAFLYTSSDILLETLESGFLDSGCVNITSFYDKVYPENRKIRLVVKCDPAATAPCQFRSKANSRQESRNGAFTVSPTSSPTSSPTNAPTASPTKNPTNAPTSAPTKSPTTLSPTKQPTSAPTKSPTTLSPTKQPTFAPTKQPTNSPTNAPTYQGPGDGTYANCLNYRGKLTESFNKSLCDVDPRNLQYRPYLHKEFQACQSYRNQSTPYDSLYPQPYAESWPVLVSLESVVVTWPQRLMSYLRYRNASLYVSCGTEADLNRSVFIQYNFSEFSYFDNCVNFNGIGGDDKLCYTNFTIPEVFQVQNCTFMWKVDMFATCFDATVVPIGIIGGEGAGLLPVILGSLLVFGLVGFCARKKRKTEIMIPERGNIEATAPLTKPTWTIFKKKEVEETPLELEDAGKIEANYIKPVAPASTSHGHFGRVREPVKVTHYGKEAPVILSMN